MKVGSVNLTAIPKEALWIGIDSDYANFISIKIWLK